MKVLVNSIPKSGTNWLASIVCAMLKEPVPAHWVPGVIEEPDAWLRTNKLQAAIQRDGVYTTHAPWPILYDRASWDTKVVFISRDPRDVVVSLAHWIQKRGKDHPQWNLFGEMGHDARISALILGVGEGQHRLSFEPGSYPGIAPLFRAFARWMPYGDCMKRALRYEDLHYDIARVVHHLAIFLEVEIDEEAVIELGSRPNRSWTYRKGKMGQWKDEFSRKHRDLFEKVGGNAIVEEQACYSIL